MCSTQVEKSVLVNDKGRKRWHALAAISGEWIIDGGANGCLSRAQGPGGDSDDAHQAPHVFTS
jgi:hypothetical protein